jgi:hypothetical protein
MRLTKTLYPFTVPAGENVRVRPYVANRAYLLVANVLDTVGAGNLWLSYGQPAAVNAGFRVQPGNGVWEESASLGGVSVQEIYLFNDGAIDLIAIVIEGSEPL